MRKLQIFLLETKVWWRIDSETVRHNDIMELKTRNLSVSLNQHQEVIDLLEGTQEKLTLELVDIACGYVKALWRVERKLQTLNSLGA